eukprot:1136702-Pelagomonas_calceolata.AAC.1
MLVRSRCHAATVKCTEGREHLHAKAASFHSIWYVSADTPAQSSAHWSLLEPHLCKLKPSEPAGPALVQAKTPDACFDACLQVMTFRACLSHTCAS